MLPGPGEFAVHINFAGTLFVSGGDMGPLSQAGRRCRDDTAGAIRSPVETGRGTDVDGDFVAVPCFAIEPGGVPTPVKNRGAGNAGPEPGFRGEGIVAEREVGDVVAAIDTLSPLKVAPSADNSGSQSGAEVFGNQGNLGLPQGVPIKTIRYCFF